MEPAHTTFSPATRADLPMLLRLMQSFYAGEGIHYDEAAAKGALLHLLSQPSLGTVWLIGNGTEQVGYFALTTGFSLEFGGKYLLLDELYIRPEHQGKGHGYAVLREAEAIAHRIKIGVLRLEVEHANERADALYQRFGFVAHERRPYTKVLQS